MNRRDFLMSGTALVLAPTISTGQQSLTPASDDAVFADFESGTYEGWTLTGNCWTPEPASNKTFPGKITGFQGQRFLCTLHPSLGNNAIGKATSKEFTVSKPFMTFRVGGGHHPDTVYVALVIEGREVITATGNDASSLDVVMWDLRPYLNKKAVIAVVDNSTASSRGYIMVDNFRFWNWPPYTLERSPKRRLRVSQSIERTGFDGTALFPVPPDDPGQKILASRLVCSTARGDLKAQVVHDVSPLNQPVYALTVKEEALVRFMGEVDVQFYDCSLILRDDLPLPSPMDTKMRSVTVQDEWTTDPERKWFLSWLETAGLLRKAGEVDYELVLRVLQYLRKSFTYRLDLGPEYDAAVQREGDFGSWKFCIAAKCGECWRLSDIFTRTLRMNGVPVRIVSGNHVAGMTGHHVRTLVWLDSAGWVPVEPTASITAKTRPLNQFLGGWDGVMLNGNENIHLSIPTSHGNFNIGTFDTLWLVPTQGHFETSTEFRSVILR